MSLYTRSGDSGTTNVIGKVVSKSSKIIDIIGSLDELNSWIGKVRTILEIYKDHVLQQNSKVFLEYEKQIDVCIESQNYLFATGSILAGATVEISSYFSLVKVLENNIDVISNILPKLQNFILPGGSKYSSDIHIARTVARRTERNFVSFIEDVEINLTYEEILKFLNRLSDYLFILARFVDFIFDQKNLVWKTKK